MRIIALIQGFPSSIAYFSSRRRHHYIESVHFTTARGEALHPALAVIQTPVREMYVLRDTGSEVGTEEEGVKMVWMDVLQCSSKGIGL